MKINLADIEQHTLAEETTKVEDNSPWDRFAQHGDSAAQIRDAWMNIARLSGADETAAAAEFDRQLPAILHDLEETATKVVH